jgi:hypothetical protein
MYGGKWEYLFLEKKEALDIAENLQRALDSNLKKFRFSHARGDTTLVLKDIRSITTGVA